jgi:hypothetical protein
MHYFFFGSVLGELVVQSSALPTPDLFSFLQIKFVQKYDFISHIKGLVGKNGCPQRIFIAELEAPGFYIASHKGNTSRNTMTKCSNKINIFHR